MNTRYFMPEAAGYAVSVQPLEGWGLRSWVSHGAQHAYVTNPNQNPRPQGSGELLWLTTLGERSHTALLGG